MNAFPKPVRRRSFAALSAALLTVCCLSSSAAGSEEAPWRQWRSTLRTDSAVIGVHATGRASPIAPEDLMAELARADYVLLGETHDNPDHHRLQAWIIERLAAKGRKPATLFEMIDAGQEEALRGYLGKDGATAEGLGDALDWEKRGWPAWTMYRPIAEAAFAVSAGTAPVLSAGGPGRDAVRAVSRGGLDAALPKPEQERMGLTRELPEALAEDLRRELFDDHCQLMPKEAMTPLVNVQRLRDAAFADRLLATGSDKSGGAARVPVLIAGGGHVRRDRGVPYYLLARKPGAKLAVVLFSEADAETKSADQTKFASASGEPIADFVWITPAAEREDQCEKLRRHMGRKPTASETTPPPPAK
jgi:uncharacterized iron-regulated protein